MSAGRRDVDPGFSAEEDEREQLTRGQLRLRKLAQQRSEEQAEEDSVGELAARPGAVPAPAPAPRVVEPTTVVKRDDPPGFRLAQGGSDMEQLAHYERTLTEAQVALEAANEQYILTAGQSLREIRDRGLFHERGCATFDDYVQSRWDFQKSYANRLIRAVPVIQALQDVAHRELKERQMRPLVSVAEAHGAEAVREVWNAALERGRTSGAGLEEVARALGYGTDGSTETLLARHSPTPVVLLQRAAKQFDDTLRSAADEDPVEVRRIVAELRELLDSVEKDIPE